jgi:uncharacterized protein YggE
MRVAAAVLLVLPTCLFAQNTTLEIGPDPRIVATATKTGRIAPDRATMYITVEGTGESTTDAAQRASLKLQAVTKALQPFVTDKNSITTMPYGVGLAPNVQGYPGASAQPNYVSRYVLRVQPRSVDQITTVAGAALSAGASSAGSPIFESTDADSVRRARYQDALTQARRDAEAMAAGLGGSLGSVVEVSSTGSGSQNVAPSYVSFGNRFDMSGPMAPPEVTVTATVTVRYRFVPGNLRR